MMKNIIQKSKYIFAFSSLFFLSGCTVYPTVSVGYGVYGGYGYPNYGYGGSYYRRSHRRAYRPRPGRPIARPPRPVHPIARPGRPGHRPAMGRPGRRPSHSMRRSSGRSMRRR